MRMAVAMEVQNINKYMCKNKQELIKTSKNQTQSLHYTQ